MSDYISREAALALFEITLDGLCLKEKVEEMPAADVKPVVRCKDCIHAPDLSELRIAPKIYFPDDICPMQCDDPWYSMQPDPDWWCANGQARLVPTE